MRSVSTVKIRPATPADAGACGRVIYDAFGAVNERHGYPSRWPRPAFAARFAADFIANSGIYAIVAQVDNDVIGCNFLDERSEVGGIGPTAVSPQVQGCGIGRLLMQTVMSRRNSPLRLLQDSFNIASLTLYTSLGFEVKEPIALLAGISRDRPSDPCRFRPIKARDLIACGELCRRVHGFDRTKELADALEEQGRMPALLSRGDQIVAYSSGFGTFAHAVAATHGDMRELILAASLNNRGAPLECLIPMRETAVFPWALKQGFSVIKTMQLMTLGAYQEPTGSWSPSVLY